MPRQRVTKPMWAKDPLVCAGTATGADLTEEPGNSNVGMHSMQMSTRIKSRSSTDHAMLQYLPTYMLVISGNGKAWPVNNIDWQILEAGQGVKGTRSGSNNSQFTLGLLR